MSNPQVRDARQDLKEAKTDRKIAEIESKISDINGDIDESGAADIEAVSETGGRVQAGNAELISAAQYRADMAKIRKGGAKLRGTFKAIRKGFAMVKAELQELHRDIGQMEARQNRYGDAFGEFHTEASAYRDQTGMFIKGLTGSLSAWMETINRDDPANPYGLAAAKLIRTWQTAGMMPEVSNLLELTALLAEAFAYYDPAIGFSSILQQDYQAVRVAVGTPVGPAAADAGLIVT